MRGKLLTFISGGFIIMVKREGPQARTSTKTSKGMMNMLELFDMKDRFEEAELIERSNDMEDILDAAKEYEEETEGCCILVLYKDGYQVDNWK